MQLPRSANNAVSASWTQRRTTHAQQHTRLASGDSRSRCPGRLFARADLAIEQAVSTGATQHAPLALREARQKMEQARQALYEENFLEARRLAAEAQASAQLALAESETARAEQLAEENQRSLQVLRDELERQEVRQ